MLLRAQTSIELRPDLGELETALVTLGRAFLELEFDPERCAGFVDRSVADGTVSEEFVDVAAIRSGGLAIRPEALFPTVDDWRLWLVAGDGTDTKNTLDITIERQGFDAVADLMRILLRERRTAALRERLSDEQWALFAPFAEDDREPREREEIRVPGIHRREHASLLIRTTTTSVLVDPVRLLVTRAPPVAPLQPLYRPDAVLISHGHADHWHLASLFDAVRDQDVPVVVPDVPQRSVLSPTVFAEELSLAKQRFEVRGWGSRFDVGDVSIEVLPFYGEQPSRDAPGAALGLRSWGNCFVVRTPELSALILVDSGADPDGDMRDVVADAVRRSGPVDAVLSCLREFPSPFFGGLEVYWAALPFSRLVELHALYKEGRMPFTTAGPEVAAELCAIAGARHFLPYAHGYEGAGVPIADIGWGKDGISEADALRRVAASARPGLTTHAWNPGDAALPSSGSFDIRKAHVRKSA